MQAENQRLWSIEIRAKSRNFNFKFNATKLSPSWKLHRLSLLLKLRSFFLRVNSDSASSISRRRQRETLKSKLRRILNKIRSKSTTKSLNRPKPEAKSALNRLQQYTKEEKICFGSVLAVILGLVIQRGEIFVFFLGIVHCIGLVLLVKKFESGKSSKLLFLSIAIIMSFLCFLVFDFSLYYMKYIKGHASEYVWLPWKILAPLIWHTLRS